MSVASNDDLYMELDRDLSGNTLSSNEQSATNPANNENLINDESFSVSNDLNEEELIEEIKKTKESIDNRDFITSSSNLSSSTSVTTLREASSDDLSISIQLGDDNSFSDLNSLKNSNVKKRTGILAKIFGPSKAERELIEAKEALQREELRKKANFILSKDKEQKVRILGESYNGNDFHAQDYTRKTQNDGVIIEDNEQAIDLSSQNIAKTPLQNSIQKISPSVTNDERNEDFDSNSRSIKLNNQSGFDDVGDNDFNDNIINNTSNIERTYRPLVFSNYDNNLKQLELKISHFNLVLGRNILPDRFKRRKKQANSEAKEELSEIDKLYLAAFSDVSIPDEDVDLDEDSVYIDDPAQIEDLFDLADQSLTDCMESAIYSQVTSLKQEIENQNEKSFNTDTAKENQNAEVQTAARRIQHRPIDEVHVEKIFSNVRHTDNSAYNEYGDNKYNKYSNATHNERVYSNSSINTLADNDLGKVNNISSIPNIDVDRRVNTNNIKRIKKRETTRITKKNIENVNAARYQDYNFSGEKHANTLVRYSAFLIDVSFLCFTCAVFSFFVIMKSFHNISVITSNSLYLIEFVLVFIKSLILVSGIYYILSYSLCQTSFGLKVMSYKLKSIDGKKPKLGQIIVRVLCMPVNFLLSIGFLGENSIHDKLSKTKLVKI